MARERLCVPGPTPVPLLGGLPRLAAFARDPLGYIDQAFRRFGPVTCLVRGVPTRVVSTRPYSPGTVFLHGPELNRAVVSQHDEFHKTGLAGPLYPNEQLTPRTRPLTRMLTGLFHVNGDQHRAQRRLMMPAFHKKRIESYRDDMVNITESVLAQYQLGDLRNVRADTMELTLRIATKTLFGADAGEAGVRVGRALQDWLKLLTLSAVLPLDVPGLPYARWLDVTAAIDAEMRAVIDQKRRANVSSDDMLSMLLEAKDDSGAPMNEDELVGHTGVIFAAGHETSSNALCWTLFLLSQHPRVAADLYDELWGSLHGDAPTIEQIGKLSLLDRVVKESLRLFPPAPLNHRIAADDCELAGHRILRGTELLVSIYHTQRAPETFSEPHRFMPERWESLDPGPYAYSPFSAGPRMCIGAAFALLEIKIVLAVMLQRFRFELARGRRLDRFVSITMGPKQGLWMVVRKPGSGYEHGPRLTKGNVLAMLS